LLLVAASAATACAVNEVAEVRLYRDVLDAGAPARLPVVADGGTLSTRDLLLLANASNEQLALAGEEYVRALIERRRAASHFLPTVELAPGYFARGGYGTSSDTGLDVPLLAAMDLSPTSDVAEVRRADAASARRLALLYAAQDGLLIDVARTEFEVLRAERADAVLANSLRVQDARVGDARARRDVGFARPLDVSLIEADAADTRVGLIEARRTAAQGRALLSFLTGARIESVALDGSISVPDELPTLGACEVEALLRRPEIAAAQLALQAAHETVEVTSGRRWPALSIDLDYLLTRDSEPSDQDWNALIALHLPLFSAGRIRADVRTALSLLRGARLEFTGTQRSVQRDCAVALENLRAAQERVAQLVLRLTSAQQAFEQAERLYDAGLGTNLERLIAQEKHVTAELALESARLDVRIFYLDLLRARGALHEWLGLSRNLQGLAIGGAHGAEAR
jgi:outer membrane protein TolC